MKERYEAIAFQNINNVRGDTDFLEDIGYTTPDTFIDELNGIDALRKALRKINGGNNE